MVFYTTGLKMQNVSKIRCVPRRPRVNRRDSFEKKQLREQEQKEQSRVEENGTKRQQQAQQQRKHKEREKYYNQQRLGGEGTKARQPAKVQVSTGGSPSWRPKSPKRQEPPLVTVQLVGEASAELEQLTSMIHPSAKPQSYLTTPP